MWKLIICLACLLACAGAEVALVHHRDGNPVEDADTVQVNKKCVTAGATYSTSFVKLSGDCPDASNGLLQIDPNGKAIVGANCIDHSDYQACTTFENEYCDSWFYKEELTGQLNWSPSGGQANGMLVLTAFDLQTGEYFCSSIYQATYVRQ